MRSRRSVTTLVAALVSIGFAVTACDRQDGRSLPPPDAGQTTTTPSTPVIADPGSTTGEFTLSSPAIESGATIPARFTCDAGDDAASPPLQWTNAPPAAELAVVVRDPDAGGFVHWVVTGIGPQVQGLAEAQIPETATEHANDGGSTGWYGPCPPAGDPEHRYSFVVHALAEPIVLAPDASPDEAATAVESSTTGFASFTATYRR